MSACPAELAFAQRSDNLLGWWAPWLGPLVFVVGVYFHFVGPRRSFLWLCLTVYVASVGEHVGNTLLGGYLGGFTGAASMTIVAFWLERIPSAPPFQVLFLPAFWLLVPGVLAVVGLADLVGNEATVALLDLGRVTFTILSVALGRARGRGPLASSPPELISSGGPSRGESLQDLGSCTSAEYAGRADQSSRITPKPHFSSVGGTASWKLRFHTTMPAT